MWQVIVAAAVVLCALSLLDAMAQAPAGIAERVMALTRDSQWTLVSSTPMQFVTHHPQGMVQDRRHALRLLGRSQDADETVCAASRRLRSRHGRGRRPSVQDRHERERCSPDLTLGEGAIYHPGGIDYDGTHIWVPVAEYRPNSRVDHLSRRPADHEGDGGVSLRRSHRRHRPQHRRPHAARRQLGLAPLLSLDARRGGKVTNAGRPPDRCARSTRRTTSTTRTASMPGSQRMLCTGVTRAAATPGCAAVSPRRPRARGPS